jgi:hypothetical protein
MNNPRPRLMVASALALVVLSGGFAAAALGAASSNPGRIPIGQAIDGTATYYNDAGYGACGTSIDAGSELLVAVPPAYWTTANPNVDPLCSGISVQVSYRGTTLTVPVRDKCPSCEPNDIDLSEPAFARLADPSLGVLSGLTWTFVRTDSAAGSSPAVSGSPTVSGQPLPPQSPSVRPSSRGSTPPHGATGSTSPTAIHRPSRTPTATGTSTPSTGASIGKAVAGKSLRVLLTGYGWWDNTPPGSSEISNPVTHQAAGGTGSYADPITVAVPYHCGSADDAGCLQWAAGTRFYLPSLQRYLIVEDVCGDGGPDSCPDSTGNHLDVWVGGRALTHAASDACEERITGRTTAILRPAANLPVTPGDICR